MRTRVTNEQDIPPWLQQMRAITGTKEVAGSGDNPAILAMADEIARVFPDMESYCAQYQHDETPWCGLAAGYCFAESNIRPPFGPTDTDKFLWAQSWADDPNYDVLSGPVPGCVVVMTRSGGGHVTLYESDDGSNIKCRGGNQSDAVNVASFPKSNVIAYVWPKGVPVPQMPPSDRPMLRKGSTGPYVVSVQTTLGIPADGQFGSVTDSAVRGYQAAAGLGVDGVVGPDTWTALDELDARKAAGNDGLDQDTIAAITQVAETSAIARYGWKDRGKAPAGYTAGVACAFGLAVAKLADGDEAVAAMAQKERADPNTDALRWYHTQFQNAGMDNSNDSIDTLRHLFALMLGLGMRESSGRYCEGRDMSASNVSADTAEAGMFQTSWNIRSCSRDIPPLLPAYWQNPNGFLATFRKGVSPSSSELGNYGTGDGAKYQFLSKYAPAFHAFVTALGMRYLRQHWGPINRSEVELRKDADAMLREVQIIVEGGSPEPIPPEPEPEPDMATVTVAIDPHGAIAVELLQGDPATPPEEAIVTVTVSPPGAATVNVIGAAEPQT
jgi:uncharacterized protein (TIGR02594 family)